MNINQCVDSLSMPLPEDILKRKWAGDFEGAIKAIDMRLEKELPPMLRERLICERERIRRLPTQYPWNRAEALAKLREIVPSVTEEQFDRWELEGRIDFIYINGEKRYFVRCHRSITKHPDLVRQAGREVRTENSWLDPMIRDIKEKGSLTKRITLETSIYVDQEYFVPGEYLAHLPFPLEQAQQSEVILLEGDPDGIAPSDAPARTVHWKRQLDAWHDDRSAKLDAELETAAGGKILGADLYLYVRQRSSVWGLSNEFISAPGLDNLLCVWACHQGFLQAADSNSIPVMAIFDSEETGSNSRQGADSTMLATILARISRCLGLDHDRMLANSMLISADMAHALHPNHPELADPSNAPVMNGGVVMKFNASKNYVTTGLSAALFRKVCAKAEVPLQIFHNRADIKGGSTLGYISMNHVSVPSVDIGLAQLAMHSSYETAGVKDPFYLEKAMTTFFGCSLETDGETYVLH